MKTKTRAPANSKNPQPWEPSAEQLEIYSAIIRGGKSFRVIGKEHGVTFQRVGQVKQQIEQWMFPRQMAAIRELKCEHTERLLHIYNELIDAWERSKLDAETLHVSETTTGKHPGTTKAKTKKGQVGNSAYLATAVETLKQIREIWGANAAPIQKGSDEDRVAGKSVDEIREAVSNRLKSFLAPQGN